MSCKKVTNRTTALGLTWLLMCLIIGFGCTNFTQSMGGQTCSMEESFAENQKHQRPGKSVCSVNTSSVNNASFT